jgi:transposase InsO family protein
MDWAAFIRAHNLEHSTSRHGNCHDNAVAESFFSSLKIERIGRKTYRTRNQAKADVFDTIERFYNPTRRHSTWGYLGPMDFERQAQVAYLVSTGLAAAHTTSILDLTARVSSTEYSMIQTHARSKVR